MNWFKIGMVLSLVTGFMLLMVFWGMIVYFAFNAIDDYTGTQQVDNITHISKER